MAHYPHERDSWKWLSSKMRALPHACTTPYSAERVPAPDRLFLRALRVHRALGAVRQPLSLMLASLLLGGVGATSAEPLPLAGSAYEKWGGFSISEPLADETTLTEYLGETDSLAPEGYRLRVSFMPRFSCEPVISVIVRLALPADEPDGAPEGTADTNDKARTLAGIQPIGFRIDGNDVDLPVIIDDDDDHAVLYYEAPTAEVRALKERIDGGNLAFLLNEAGESVAFSLFGSRRTLEAVESRCRNHPPDES